MTVAVGFPRELLERPSEERLAYFRAYTVAHPLLAEAKEKLGPQGFDLAPPMAPATFHKLIVDDLATWVPIVKASGATAN